MMGGGPDNPSSNSSGEKELVLCALPWPEAGAKKGIEGLKEEFNDVEVKYFDSTSSKGQGNALDVPEGTYESPRLFLMFDLVPPSFRCGGTKLTNADYLS
jgi:hypothetical protein